MSLSRRSLLSAFAAISGTGMSGVRPAQIAAAAVAASTGLEAVRSPSHAYPSTESAHDVWWDTSRGLRYKLLRKVDRYSTEGFRPPVHIEARRSWSPTYKDHVARAERDALRAILDALDNETTGAKVLRILTGEA